MAVISKKDKLIEEAQKLITRGQFDKAAKSYEQVLSLEPSAINHRQKLAELLIKAGRFEDARKEFETIGKHFSNNGFYLKAIAVYKQLQKLFPSDISISLTLAGLNEKHGLTANALSEYKLVYDYFEKNGPPVEALKILDKMQVADPQNVTVKIKLAEAYFQNGKKDDAYALFVKTAGLLIDRGDSAGVSKLSARVIQLLPKKSDFMLEVLTAQVMSGNTVKAVNALQGLLRNNPGDKRLWDLIVEAYKRTDQPQRVKLAYQHYHKMLPAEPAPKLGLMFCCAAERDVKGALDLLELHEKSLISAGLLVEMEKLYRTLDEIDPINVKVLEGLIRVVKAAGDERAVTVFSDKLNSISRISAQEPLEPDLVESGPGLYEDAGFFSESGTDSSFSSEFQQGQIEAFNKDDTGLSLLNETATEVESDIVELDDLSQFAEEDIEIELDIDDDSEAVFSSENIVGDVLDNNGWLDSVGDLFDTIATAPSGVRYGSEMESSDAQSHFDLGLAFKEMGLFDEAINEFRKASSDSARRMACLIMQGACLRERGEFDTAINMLNTLLKPGLSSDDSCAIKYELVLTYESSGNTEEATRLLNEIDSDNPHFRDVSSRLNAANVENALDFSDDDFKNF